MALTPGEAHNYMMTLRVGGVPLNIAPASIVSAQLLSPDEGLAFVQAIAVPSTTTGSNWPEGVVVIPFTAQHTNAIMGSQVLLTVTVSTQSDSKTWSVLLDVAGGIRSALFEKTEAIRMMRSDLLIGSLTGYVDPDQLSDGYLWSKLQAAEADVARQLRVFLQPTYVLPFPVPATDLSVVPPGMPWVEEPGYDYEPDLFQGEGWGYLITRHKPIISVDYIQFAYPQPMNSVWNLPLEWLRLDKKYGHLRIVPAGTSYSAPFSAWMMQVLGGGRNIPQMIRVRYKAGLENAAVQYPDLLDVVKKMSVLRILDDALPAGSESISADGLSQSKSLDLSGYRDAIEHKMDALNEAIHGVKLMVI